NDVAGFVDLTALNRRGVAKGPTDRLRQGFSTVNDEEPRHRRIEATLDQIIDKRLDGCGVLRRTLGKAERVLVAPGIDTNRYHQNQVLSHVDAVDLDHYHIQSTHI